MNWLYKIINGIIIAIIIILICIIGVDNVAFSSFVFCIICWFIDRYEKNRPYLEVTFEPIRDSLACVIIRNSGNTPLKLTSMKFNSGFINQFDKEIVDRFKKMEEIDVKIFPNRQRVLSLNKMVSDVVKLSETVLEIEYTYEYAYKNKKPFKEKISIDFSCHSCFLVYLSEIDEIKKAIKEKSVEIVKICDNTKNV